MKKREAAAQFKDLLTEFPALVKLIFRLIRDPRVSKFDKALLAAAALYVLNPIDLVPDLIPVLGQIDDAYLAALILLRLMSRTDESVLQEHWDGEAAIVPLLDRIVRAVSFYLPASLSRVLLGKSDGRGRGGGRGDPVQLD